MNKIEIEMIVDCHKNIEKALVLLLEDVDNLTFDQTSKESALSKLRSRIIETRKVVAKYIIPHDPVGSAGLPRHSEITKGGPDAA